MLTRRELALAMASSVVFSRAARANIIPRLGAIRWDAWFEGSPYSAGLDNPKWSNRVPEFTTFKNGSSCICGSDVDTLRHEGELAANFGIDYFLFNYYPRVGSDGKQKPEWVGMGQALKNFVTIPQDKTQFSVSFGGGMATYLSEIETEYSLRQISSYFLNRNYLRTASNCPVIFCLINDNGPFLNGKPQYLLTQFLKKLSDSSLRLTGHRTYAVVLNFWPDRATQLLKAIPFDAFSSYGNPRGANSGGEGRQLSFDSCSGGSRTYWKSARATGMPFLPPISLGWDYRPMLDNPTLSKGRNPRGDFCTMPTGAEISDLVAAALTEASTANQLFPSALIYAWNEYSEGGYIAPTRVDGLSRLEAVKAGAIRYRTKGR